MGGSGRPRKTLYSNFARCHGRRATAPRREACLYSRCGSCCCHQGMPACSDLCICIEFRRDRGARSATPLTLVTWFRFSILY